MAVVVKLEPCRACHRRKCRCDLNLKVCRLCSHEFRQNSARQRVCDGCKPTAVRAYYNKMKFGLNHEVYKNLVTQQNGVCAGCLKPNIQQGKQKFLCVDHDHESGAVRGLLCDNCNLGLGYLQDDPEIMQRLITYLSASAKRRTA